MQELIHQVDETVPAGCTKKVDLEKKKAYQKFVQDHCKVRYYMFSTKKCSNPSCICKPPKLPSEIFQTTHHLPDPIPDQSGDHFKEYKELYGKVEMTEGHRPSLAVKPVSSAMPILSSAQNATTQK